MLLDDDDSIRAALSTEAGIDADAIVDHLDAIEVRRLTIAIAPRLEARRDAC